MYQQVCHTIEIKQEAAVGYHRVSCLQVTTNVGRDYEVCSCNSGMPGKLTL